MKLQKNALRLVVLLFGMSSAFAAFAAGVIETLSGDVKAGISAGAARPATVKQRVNAGTTLVTGAKSSATIRFEDGAVIAVHENSEFKVSEYSFNKEAPAKDKFSFDLVKGALRAVTATATTRTPDAFALRTPTATMGVRGTDFMVAITNPLFVQVIAGAVNVVNAAGTVVFSVGATGVVTVPGALATTISATALPANVLATFSQLGSLTTLTVGATGGAVTATTTAAGGAITTTTVAIGAAAAAALVTVVQQQQKKDDEEAAARAAAAAANTSTGTR